ncbi:MAG: hypothetical protein COA96_10810 [SAR86 cluster bacterium]|uniref:Dienelactone hydrolase domain-containing protein n=1 Tax=SAR86 cluster bacterium TaxID=2030880 RepID=A0A2A5AX71_9GAMM|nr:MAG: hypothetical protein COA96_10810 [SAR86 cluster bacterium]
MATLKTYILSIILTLSSSVLLASEETLILGDNIPIKVLFFEPEGTSSPPPLAIMIAGGSSNEFMARAQFWLGTEFVERGWAIAVPISPNGKRFSVENASLFPELIERLHNSHQLNADKPILVGISSGGSAAIAIAAKNPTIYKGVIATPGRIKHDVSLPDLKGLPIYLRVGERDDFRWHRSLHSMVERLLLAGAKVDAAIMPNQKHIFRLDWSNLESWLEELK